MLNFVQKTLVFFALSLCLSLAWLMLMVMAVVCCCFYTIMFVVESEIASECK